MKQAAGGESRVGDLEVDGVGMNGAFREGNNISTHEPFIDFDGYLNDMFYRIKSLWLVNVSLSNASVSEHMKNVGRRKGTNSHLLWME